MICFQVIVNDFRERIEQYNGELVQVKIHLIKVFFLTQWRCKGELLMDQYLLGCKRNSRTMLMLQMLIEKDELQQEQEGVIFVFFIKIHSQTFPFSALFLLWLFGMSCATGADGHWGPWLRGVINLSILLTIGLLPVATINQKISTCFEPTFFWDHSHSNRNGKEKILCRC